MDLKFFLNKFAKIDNIEHYTYRSVLKMREIYNNYLDNSEGFDPDFPLLNFRGGDKGKRLNLGTNIFSQFGDEENIPDNFNGLADDLIDIHKPEIIGPTSPQEARQKTKLDREASRKHKN